MEIKEKYIRNTCIEPRDIEGEIIKTIEEGYFPPIVNRNAELNAESITIEDGDLAYRNIRESFEALKDKKSAHKLLEECILSNEKTFLWFCTFMKALEPYNTKYSDKYEIPYNLIPERKNKTFLYFFSPFNLKVGNGFYRVLKKQYNIGKVGSQGGIDYNLINKHRVEYISYHYEAEEFRKGYPSWYYPGTQTIYERYSNKINRRVSIRHNKGEFQYFISGASDNWQQIMDVPIEIDEVIAALLFTD